VDYPNPEYSSAVSDFHKARNRAILREIIARFTGKSTELLSYEEVRQKLKARESSSAGLQEIPLDAIVGSVNRYSDFTRDFLPRQNFSQGRWARVKVATTGLVGLPPIEVYQIGETYFVKDGNHRVSVARESGAVSIQAYVTQVRSRVPLTPDVHPEDLILMAELVEFLERTRIDELRPGADLRVTVPGQYSVLEEHISVHRYYMGIDEQREIPYEEAVGHWYDAVYLPIVDTIREQGILHYFPGRTEADLYLWIAGHRAALQEQFGFEIHTVAALDDLADKYGANLERIAARVGEQILEVVTLGMLDTGPPPGTWRVEIQAEHREDHLFSEILVPISGHEGGWRALEQAIILAQRESTGLLGLHVVHTEPEAESEAINSLRREFEQRCQAASVSGKLMLAVGDVSTQICRFARWTDIIVLNLAYPPPAGTLAKIGSGFRDLIHNCPRPILAVPGAVSQFEHSLLAYDGSQKAEEALFVSAYLAGHFGTRLVVVHATDHVDTHQQLLARAREYLEDHHIQAEYLSIGTPPAKAILKAAAEIGSDLLIIGGYGHTPVLEVVLGSVVDEVLRGSRQPILICR